VIRNIIFDWSGTLVDDLPAVLEASNYVLAQAGKAAMSLDQFRAEFSLPFTGFYDRHTPDVPMRQLEAWFHSRFKEAQHTVVELPHAREFLQFCRTQKLRTFLLSTIHSDHFAVQSSVTGFGAYLDRPYTDVWDKRKKIRALLAENNLRPEQTLFIGDMEHDIETAHHGGVHSCAVLTGYNTLAQLRAARPGLIVEHLGELRRALEEGDLDFGAAVDRQSSRQKTASPGLPIPTVGGLIFNRAGEVLMVKTHKWSDKWGIPGGKIQWGETSPAALRREIREETGLKVADIQFVLAQDCVRSKEFYRDAHFILLNYTCRVVGRSEVTLNHEAQSFRWVTLAAAKKLKLNRPTRTLLAAVLKKNTGGRRTSPSRKRHV
jgi:8-oxo-dGTP pyrophosphatase MutT (NUDIX family)